MWREQDDGQEWTEKWWFATSDDIRGNDYNLSANRYRPLAQIQVEHRDPMKLLDELTAIEFEIMEEIGAAVFEFLSRVLANQICTPPYMSAQIFQVI